MRLTNVLNIGLLALVIVTCGGGIVAWIGISVLRDQLEVARWAETVNDANAELDEALRGFQQARDARSETEVRSQIAAVEHGIVKLSESGAQSDIVSKLDAAKDHYAAAFDAYVEQGSLKGQALATVNAAAVSLNDTATAEMLLVEEENAQAFKRAEVIERRQTLAFQMADRFTEVLVALSRMRQAADAFSRTSEEGPERTVGTALGRIQTAIADMAKLDKEFVSSRRFSVFQRWLDTYGELFARTAKAKGDASEMQALQAQLKRAAPPLQTEADRLRDHIQTALRSAIDDANRERDRIFLVGHRNTHLTGMHQALRDVLSLVRILKETEGSDLTRLADDMSGAMGQLRLMAAALFSPADPADQSEFDRRGPKSVDVRGYSDGAAGITLAILDLERSWQAAVAAAVEQESRSSEMAEAASEADAIIGTALEHVKDKLNDGIDEFFLFVSLATAAGVLFSAVGAGYVYRHVTQPLAALTKAISLLAKGDLSAPVPQFRTGVELTELAEAAEVLRRSSLERIQLERENARKARRLVKKRAEAEKLELSLRKEQEKMQLQRKFVAMVSHEFRTPLAVIDGQAQGILRRLDSISPEKLSSRMAKVKANVERLIGLMESMLSSSRLEAGTINFASEQHDLRELVADVCAHQAEISASHDIAVDIEALPRGYVGDPRLLRQVISNLLSNAVKYSPDARKVEVTGVQDGAGYRIDVRDYGLGIPEDELPKLTSQFFRASTSTGIAGTGIGLHLVKAFIDMHGGSLTVISTVGEGSTFSIHLPGAADQMAA
ncbi:MAG: HAMP domain-containing sensor histidine kinase [Alphaproteobacteria bacterium]